MFSLRLRPKLVPGTFLLTLEGALSARDDVAFAELLAGSTLLLVASCSRLLLHQALPLLPLGVGMCIYDLPSNLTELWRQGNRMVCSTNVGGNGELRNHDGDSEDNVD